MQKFMETVIHAVQTWTDDKIKKNKKQLDDRISNSAADWNQNDSCADNYVKNRTHWEETKENILLPEITVTISEDSNGYYELGRLSYGRLIVGQTYLVNLNGTEYTCVARNWNDGNDISLIGNGTIYGDGNESNGEPFSCDSYDDGTIYLNASAGTYTISISIIETIIHKIDEKYLPKSVSTPDWNQNDPQGDGYIENRPFYKEENIEELIFEGEVHFDEDGIYRFDPRINLIDGKNYTIVFDGHVYNGVAYFDDIDFANIICIQTVSGDNVRIDPHYMYCVDVYHNVSKYLKIFIGSLRVAKIDAMFIPEDIRKMSTFNPSGNGSFSMNVSSFADIGECSHTEGFYSLASGDYSHAEGNSAVAPGQSSHAEGSHTFSSGISSHAEGGSTEAYGDYSHTEGYRTIARAKSQSVSGEYNIPEGEYFSTETKLKSDEALCSFSNRDNIYYCDGYTFDKSTGLYTLVPVKLTSVYNGLPSLYNRYFIYGGESGTTMYYGRGYDDGGWIYVYKDCDKHTSTYNATTRGKYAHIVGNGTRTNNRSNAHTLDWNGLGWFAGGLKVGGTGQDDESAVEVALKTDIPSTIVQTVNGIAPDENGNVEITIPDSSPNGNVYIGPDQPTDGTLYWLDTSGDNTGDEIEPVTYAVETNLTKVTIDNAAESVTEGESYAAVIIPADGYALSGVSVTMGGVDITNTAYASGNIYIASVTGNVVITAVAVEISEETTTYTITNNLVNVTSDNPAVTVEENTSYTAKLTVADGYKLDTVTVEMNGVDVTATVYADGVITIPAVTGDVVITATTVKQPEYNTAVAVVEANVKCNLYEDDGETVISSDVSSKRITSETVDNDTEVEITLSMTSTSYGGMYVQSYDEENSKFYRRETFPKNGDQYFNSGKSYTYIYTIKAGCKLSFSVSNNNYTMFNITVMRKG